MEPSSDISRHESSHHNQVDSEEDFLKSTHSFVVRIFLEAAATKHQPAEWRGLIRETKSDVWRAVQQPMDIVNYITPYLQRMGVDVDCE